LSRELTQTSDELDEAYKVVEKMTRWCREIIHKLNCVDEDLEDRLNTQEVKDSLLLDIKDRIGECEILAKCLSEELSE